MKNKHYSKLHNSILGDEKEHNSLSKLLQAVEVFHPTLKKQTCLGQVATDMHPKHEHATCLEPAEAIWGPTPACWANSLQMNTCPAAMMHPLAWPAWNQLRQSGSLMVFNHHSLQYPHASLGITNVKQSSGCSCTEICNPLQRSMLDP